MRALIVTVTERYYVDAVDAEHARLIVEHGHGRLMDAETEVTGALGGSVS